MKAEINSNKKCNVCGDKATGFNYCALTCESCKIFFYRYQSKIFKCIKEGTCDIDIATRKSCQKCRMEKCLSIGMKKTIANVNSKVKIQTISDQNKTLRKILQFKSEEFEESKQVSHKRSYHLKARPIPFELKHSEQKQIELIQNAISSAFEDETKLEIVGQVNHFYAIRTLQWPDLYARRIVRFCKNILAFKQLKKEDQLIILREFVIELLAVRIAFLMDIEKNGYPVIRNEIGNDALFVTREIIDPTKNIEIKKNNEKFLNSLHWEMENDSTIRDLIISILLFETREKISNPEFIKYQYSLHCRLLRKYLLQKYKNTYRAMRKYQTLTSLMEYCKVLRETSRFLYLESNVRELPEILVEVFKLGT